MEWMLAHAQDSDLNSPFEQCRYISMHTVDMYTSHAEFTEEALKKCAANACKQQRVMHANSKEPHCLLLMGMGLQRKDAEAALKECGCDIGTASF